MIRGEGGGARDCDSPQEAECDCGNLRATDTEVRRRTTTRKGTGRRVVVKPTRIKKDEYRGAGNIDGSAMEDKQSNGRRESTRGGRRQHGVPQMSSNPADHEGTYAAFCGSKLRDLRIRPRIQQHWEHVESVIKGAHSAHG